LKIQIIIGGKENTMILVLKLDLKIHVTIGGKESTTKKDSKSDLKILKNSGIRKDIIILVR